MMVLTHYNCAKISVTLGIPNTLTRVHEAHIGQFRLSRRSTTRSSCGSARWPNAISKTIPIPLLIKASPVRRSFGAIDRRESRAFLLARRTPDRFSAASSSNASCRMKSATSFTRFASLATVRPMRRAETMPKRSRTLKLARELGIWFHRTFATRVFPGAFVPPPDPAAATKALT